MAEAVKDEAVSSCSEQILMKNNEFLFSPNTLIALLKEKNLSLKSRYGQNFLINKDIASRILSRADLQKDDTVLEIGPGLGTLTFLIAEKAKEVIAVEIDRGFSSYLYESIEKFGYRNIHLITKDFSKLKPSDLVSFPFPTKVVSNFPYNIGIRAVVKIVEELRGVKRITGTLQRETAERLTARLGEKNYSYISVYIQYMTRIDIVERSINPRNFFPVPEIESVIVDMKRVEPPFPVEEALFKRVVRMSFGSRRKSLLNNLASSMNEIEKGVLRQKIKQIFSNEDIRAEELTVKDFTSLSKALREYL